MEAVLNLELPDCIPVAPHLGCGYTPTAAGYPIGDLYVADNEGIADIYLKAYQRHPSDWIFSAPGRPDDWFKRYQEISRDNQFIYIKDTQTGITNQYPLNDTWPYGTNHMSLDDAIATYNPAVNPELLFHNGSVGALEILSQKIGEEVFIGTSIQGPIHALEMLIGLENLCVALYEAPHKVEEMFSRVIKKEIAVAHACSKAGSHFVAVCETNCGADTISPAMFSQMILPYEKQLVKELQRFNYTILGFSGSVMPIIEDLAEVGAHALWVEMSLKNYKIDIGEVKKAVGKRCCMMGNVDSIHTMLKGSVQDVENEVREQIAKAGDGGEYILSTGSQLEPGTPAENVDALIRATRKYGKGVS